MNTRSIGYFLLAIHLTLATVSAQTSNWTGTVDTTWNDAGNWDNGVPNIASEIAVIGAPSPTQININVTLGGLTVLPDGILNVGIGRNFNFDPAATISNQGEINIDANTDFQLANIVNNSGTINVEGSGFPTDLELTVDATLDGTGEVVLGGDGARINDSGGVRVLTNGANHTIRGVGDVGVNTIDIVNEGLITADVSGGTLLLDPNSVAGTLTNNGTLRSENNGVLLFGSGVFNNASGVIESAGGQVRFTQGAVLNNGSISGADIFVEANVDTEFNDVTFVGPVSVSTNTDFRVSGVITNNATITIDGSGSPTDVELSAATTFGGTGTLVLDGNAARFNDTGGVQVLTNGANHTISGSGDLGNDSIDIVNNGLVTANVSGDTMQLNPSSTTGTVTNNGTLQATNGGTLRFGSGIFNNTGGVIESAGGQIRFTNAAVTNGGTITGSDIFVEPNINVEFADTTFDGTVNVATNSDFRITNTVTNNGIINIDGSGISPADVELAANATINGTGTLFLNGTTARINDLSGTQQLTNAAGHTLAGDGGNIGANTISIVNNGVILGDGNASPLIVDPAGGATSSTFSGNGTIRALNGGSVFLEPAAYQFEEGLFEAIGSGSLIDRDTAVFNIFFGSFRAIDGGSVRIFDQGPDGALTFDGDLLGNLDDNVIELRGATSDTDIFNNTANFELSNGQTVGSPVSVPGSGYSRLFGANEGTFTIGDDYDFRAGGFGGGDFTNTGTITAEAGSQFSAAGYDIVGITTGSSTVFRSTAANSFINTGTLAGSGTFANSNTLFGQAISRQTNSFLEGDFIESDGIIAPGDSATEPGMMTLHARDIILGDSNDIQIDIGATAFDAIDFITEPTTGLSGNPDTINTVELNGELSINLLPGYLPVGGDSFVILTADDGFVGTFDTETLPTLGGGVSLSLDYTATEVTLNVDGVVGDYNADGTVDLADYTVWRNTLGSTSNLSADGDFNGTIDLGDYSVWKANFGATATSVTSVTVPEPTGLMLLAFGILAIRGLRQNRIQVN